MEGYFATSMHDSVSLCDLNPFHQVVAILHISGIDRVACSAQVPSEISFGGWERVAHGPAGIDYVTMNQW